MKHINLRLAVYGKCGIGKTTVAASISATPASRGLRVLQIGCDPEYDSTRLLLKGRTVGTMQLLETLYNGLCKRNSCPEEPFR